MEKVMRMATATIGKGMKAVVEAKEKEMAVVEATVMEMKAVVDERDSTIETKEKENARLHSRLEQCQINDDILQLESRRLQGDTCVNDDSRMDAWGYTCTSGYDGFPQYCTGNWDDDDFEASTMCCECGGGLYRCGEDEYVSLAPSAPEWSHPGTSGMAASFQIV